MLFNFKLRYLKVSFNIYCTVQQNRGKPPTSFLIGLQIMKILSLRVKPKPVCAEEMEVNSSCVRSGMNVVSFHLKLCALFWDFL